MHCIYGGVLGVEPVLGDSRANEPIHTVARMEARDVLADGHDRARSLGAEHVRELRLPSVRLGEHSRMVITGDLTQIDLPSAMPSGLKDALHILDGVDGIGRVTFTDKDVVRHTLVQRIVKAYERYNDTVGTGRQLMLKLDNPAPENGNGEGSVEPARTATAPQA